ncbi:hypothetical protein ACOSQ4_013790 [Xanthoceras sorbifolium]
MFLPKTKRSSLMSRLRLVGLSFGSESDSWVFKDKKKVNSVYLSSIAKLVPIVEALAMLDILCLNNSETSMASIRDLLEQKHISMLRTTIKRWRCKEEWRLLEWVFFEGQ